ncbi:MAG: prepilin-type N-terminal cleavage/methylation domain-containing protein [Saccharofermentans sp.]|nr:prepilin-type N-terminal cleavage/methylation domain-containing protein [Saccharofermentans sp.]
MKKIRTSKKGFTLAELLIVVAIIGVLVGISIPIFSAQLRKSKVATNQANARAAKAAAVAQFLDDEKTATTYYEYDVETGVATEKTAAVTTTDADDPKDNVADKIGVTVTVDANGNTSVDYSGSDGSLDTTIYFS